MDSDNAIKSVDRANKFIRILTVVTLVMILAMMAYTLFGVYTITQKLEQQATWQAEQNETLIRALTTTTEHQHAEQIDFVKCITRVPLSERPSGLDVCFK